MKEIGLTEGLKRENILGRWKALGQIPEHCLFPLKQFHLSPGEKRLWKEFFSKSSRWEHVLPVPQPEIKLLEQCGYHPTHV